MNHLTIFDENNKFQSIFTGALQQNEQQQQIESANKK